ncbi:MAG TPA: crotonase/enoyl-CoA hydratase family protein [Phycisphaerae bacterium]
MNTPSPSPPSVTAVAEGPLWIVTISRPQARNAVDMSVAHGLESAMAELDERPDLRVAILTGADGNFCAGMDLKAFAKGERPWLPGAGFAGLVERSPRKPLIAAVEGYALAGGLEIALACDLLIASRSACFGIPEVKRGLAAAAGGLMGLPLRVPRALAMELALTGRHMDAEEAWRAGLLNRLVEEGNALAAARELALEIAANAPLAVAASKQVLRESRSWSEDERFTRQHPLVEPVISSEDALEGARAFAEKRTPLWRGR